MTKRIKTTLITLVALIMMTTVFAQEKKNINTSISSVTWIAKKLVGIHNGSLKFKKGSLSFQNNRLVGGSFVVDMTTINVMDLKPGKGKEKLEAHLNSDDFFSTKKHPTAKLVIKKATNTGTAYDVTADLTIKGITNPITFELTVLEQNAAATLEIDRTAFNIRYGSGRFFQNLGDKAIADKFMITVFMSFRNPPPTPTVTE